MTVVKSSLYSTSPEPSEIEISIVELRRQRLVNRVVSRRLRSHPYLDNWVIRNAVFLSVTILRGATRFHAQTNLCPKPFPSWKRYWTDRCQSTIWLSPNALSARSYLEYLGIRDKNSGMMSGLLDPRNSPDSDDASAFRSSRSVQVFNKGFTVQIV